MLLPDFYLSPPEKKFRPWKMTLEWAQTILYVAAFYIAVTTIFVEPYQIPSDSMQPTLEGDPGLFIGDRVIALKWISKLWPFKRGEVIIFISAEDHKTFIVKRLIGLPGDTIEIKPPNVWVNGKKIKHPHFAEKYAYVDPRMPREAGFVSCTPDSKAKEMAKSAARAIMRDHPKYEFLGSPSYARGRANGTYYLFTLQVEKKTGAMPYELFCYRYQSVKDGATKFLSLEVANRSFLQGFSRAGERQLTQIAKILFEHSRLRGEHLQRLIGVNSGLVKEASGKFHFFILEFQGSLHKEYWRALFYENQVHRYLILQDKVRTFYGLDTPYRVPVGHYFAMGDNSDNSNDGRYWGPLPQSNVLGKAILVFWPIGHAKTIGKKLDRQ